MNSKDITHDTNDVLKNEKLCPCFRERACLGLLCLGRKRGGIFTK